jgi:hypothetical protein
VSVVSFVKATEDPHAVGVQIADRGMGNCHAVGVQIGDRRIRRLIFDSRIGVGVDEGDWVDECSTLLRCVLTQAQTWELVVEMSRVYAILNKA